MATRIALIHAVAVAMPPVHAAFGALWPEADLVDLLDNALSRDRSRDGMLTAAMHGRIRGLADYAVSTGADAILFTCSAFGEAIQAAAEALPIPVLKPNEAMFTAALAVGPRIAMLATFPPSVSSMEGEFRDMAIGHGSSAEIETVCIPEAMQALQAGDGDEHDRLLAEAASSFVECDALLLAHFSTSRAEAAVRAAIAFPVMTAPGAAVATLKQRLSG